MGACWSPFGVGIGGALCAQRWDRRVAESRCDYKSSGMARSLLLLYYNLVLLISLRTVLCRASLFSCSSPGLAVAELTMSSRRYLARSLSFA